MDIGRSLTNGKHSEGLGRHTISHPVRPSVDLRDMLRQHIIERALRCTKWAKDRRRQLLNAGDVQEYCHDVKKVVDQFYGQLPVARNGAELQVTRISSFEKDGFRVENVLFDSFPGWQVNGSVYVPTNFEPPFPAVVFPADHSGKQYPTNQLPAQVLARSGYLTIAFDPPGADGEKQPGNDHFVDGVRSYLVGETSSRYFVTDAMRCIDYLESRDDVDISFGVAMTGVSGGGFTTMLCALLDDRIAAIGVSCCVSSAEDLYVTQCYAGCPETHMWGRYTMGVDDVDLLCAGYPKPTLVMAGIHDEVFRAADTERLAEEVKAFYTAGNAEERFEFLADNVGHCYTIDQARYFAGFLNRWLLDDPDREVPEILCGNLAMIAGEELSCHPDTGVNMRSITLQRANELEKKRAISVEAVRKAAVEIVRHDITASMPECATGKTFRVFSHFYQQLLLRPEMGIEMPATFLYAVDTPTSAVLHFDPLGRNRLLESHGLLAGAVNFLDQVHKGFAVLSVDLRGWGDSHPATYPYELAFWGSSDRWLAYMSAALGDGLMSMRIRDALASLAYLRSRPEIDPNRIVITGCGLGGVVALHTAMIDGRVGGVVIWDSLLSFKAILEKEDCAWPADAFMPNVLLRYDLPELTATLPCPVHVLNPLDGAGQPIVPINVEMLNVSANREIYEIAADTTTISNRIRSVLKSGRPGGANHGT
ncbi:MAG: alpha/beta hydrolase [Armatimonadota bacterium]